MPFMQILLLIFCAAAMVAIGAQDECDNEKK